MGRPGCIWYRGSSFQQADQYSHGTSTGHVNNAKYMTYIESARIAHFARMFPREFMSPNGNRMNWLGSELTVAKGPARMD